MPSKKTSIFHDAGATFLSRIAVLILTVGIQSLLAWLLGPADRGSLAVCQVFSFVLFLLFTVGINASGIFYISSKKISLSEGVINILAVCILCSSIAVACGLIAMNLDLPLFEKAERSSFILSLMTIPTLMMQISLINLLTAVNEFNLYSILSAMDQFLLFSLTALFVGLFQYGVNGALLAYLLEGSITTITVLFFLRARYKITVMAPQLSKMRMLFIYGIRYHFGKISNFANLQMGTIFMAFLASRADVGNFAVATQSISKINIIPDTLATVLMPRVSASNRDRSDVIARTARLTFILCSAILLMIAIFAKPIVAVLFSPSFYGAVPIIRILAFGFLFRSATKVYEPYLMGIDRPGSVSFSSIASAVINLILILALIPHLGINGAALGTSLAYLAGGLILLYSFKKYSCEDLFRIISIQRTDIDYLKTFWKRAIGKVFRTETTIIS